MGKSVKRICVFCGSNFGKAREYEEGARALGQAIAEAGYGLVYGGAKVGLMGTVADAALEAGGEVIGVLPAFLSDLELAHEGLSELHRVDTMHERKALMADLSDGFAVLPGGAGTLEEMAEVYTWTQLGLHAKAVGLFNILGYFDGLLSFLDHAADQAFMKAEHRNILFAETDAKALVDKIIDAKIPQIRKWIDRTTR